MSVTLTAAYIALEIGPFVALVLALPYVVLSYSRTKSVDVWKCTYFYAFCLYFLCAYFVTWLPLPTEETLAKLKPVPEFIQLVPFQSFMDIEMKSIFRDLAIIIFNVFLTVPLGYFLRTFFGFSMKKTVFFGFLVSMLYEITQLTGLFFIYPRPYRIFDVDDLIINTLGAYLGYIMAPFVSSFLPGSSDSGNLRLVQGSEVSFFHRSIAAVVDFLLVFVCAVQIIIWVPFLHRSLAEEATLMRFPVFFALFMAVAAAYNFIFGKNTLGCKLSGLHLMTSSGKIAGRGKYMLRTVLLYVCVFAIPFWVMFFMSIYTEYTGPKSIVWMLISAVLMMCAAHHVLELTFNAVTNGSSMFYDRWTKTHMAYTSSSKTSLFGIRIIDILPLSNENVDKFSEAISRTLLLEGVSELSVKKMRLMCEWVMLEWRESGLEGTVCELRLDKRLKRKSLILSMPGENKTTHSFSDEDVDMPGNMELRLETYYAGGKNICIIHIP